MANEDYSTLPMRKLLIAIARSCIGAHYLKGGNGEVPDISSGGNPLTMVPPQKETIDLNGQPFDWGTYFTAANRYERCSGRYGHPDVEKRMANGDENNPGHLANPDSFKWKRVIKWNKYNPLWGESCGGKMHFDCSGFVKWCFKQVIPGFREAIKNDPSIGGIKGKLIPIGVGGANKEDLCVADILIRKKEGHIGFAVGEGQRVIQAEWQPTGVVETDLGQWEFHGRIPREYWINLPAFEEYD